MKFEYERIEFKATKNEIRVIAFGMDENSWNKFLKYMRKKDKENYEENLKHKEFITEKLKHITKD